MLEFIDGEENEAIVSEYYFISLKEFNELPGCQWKTHGDEVSIDGEKFIVGNIIDGQVIIYCK